MKYDRLGECSPEGLFDNLSGSHFQSQVISVTSDSINALVVDVIGQVVMLSKSVIITMISQCVVCLLLVSSISRLWGVEVVGIGLANGINRANGTDVIYRVRSYWKAGLTKDLITGVWFMY